LLDFCSGCNFDYLKYLGRGGTRDMPWQFRYVEYIWLSYRMSVWFHVYWCMLMRLHLGISPS
jgi:hypothetical protein